MTGWWIAGGAVAWTAVAVGLGVLIGRVIRLRDSRGPGDHMPDDDD